MRRAFALLCVLAVLPSVAAKEKHDAAWVSDHLVRLAPSEAPYRLRARLELVAEDGSPVPGLYERLWASPTEWREEIRIADYRDSVGVAGGRSWSSRSLPFRPWNVRLAVQALDLRAPWGEGQRLDLQKIPARDGRPDLVCIGVGGAKGSWACVDAEGGRLVLREHLPLHIRFDYGVPKEFPGGAWPAEVHLIDAGRDIGRLVVERFEPLDAAELLKMAPPKDAEMLFACKESRRAELQGDSKVKPVYPPELLHLREPGYAFLQIGIDEEGHVIDPQALRASHPRFAEAAVEAVRKWRYLPALCDGKPRKTLSEVTVTFER